MQRPEQNRGAEIVLGDVVGDVGEVDAEPDHRRLVTHRVDAPGGLRDRGEILHVVPVILDSWIEVVGTAAVSGRMQAVEHDDFVVGGDQLIDDVRADESGAAGHEDAHQTDSREVAA